MFKAKCPVQLLRKSGGVDPMTDLEFMNITRRGWDAGIEITRRGADSFNVKRGESMFFFRIPGDTYFSRTVGCRLLAKEVQEILQSELPGTEVVATGKWFHIQTMAAPRPGLTVF